MTPILWPLVLFSVLVVVLVAAMLGLSSVLGERGGAGRFAEPYESGIVPTAPARRAVPVKYYLVAVAFVVFDLEAAYIYAWVAAFGELGWYGYIEMMVFVVLLLAALFYFLRIGALDWRPADRSPEPLPRRGTPSASR